MQQLLFAVVLLEIVVIITFSFKTSIRKLLIMGLGRVKRGRGPMVVKTVSATICVVLVSSVYSMMKIQKRWVDDESVNPTDEVIMAKHLLESTLMGGVLFLGLMIDRLHHYMRKLRIRRKKQALGFESGKAGASSNEIRELEDETKSLLEKQKELESELETMSKEVRTGESSELLCRNNPKGFLLSLTGCLRKTRIYETS